MGSLQGREAEEAAIRHAEREAMRAEEIRQQKAERAAIMAAGGRPAREARWQEASSRTLQKSESEYGLCQWSEETGRPGDCFLETDEVYCAKHNRQLERESASRRQLKEVK